MSYPCLLAGVLVLSSGGVLWADDPQVGGAVDDPFDLEPSAPREQETAEPSVTRIWVDSDPEGTAEVLTVLRRERVSEEIVFGATPLDEVIDRFEARHGISVVIDEVALNDLGIVPSEPITCRVPAGLKLCDALRLVLDPIDCVTYVRGGYLAVTTIEAATSPDYLLLAVYPVHDVLHDGDFAALIQTIATVIDVNSWAMNGGSEGAELAPYPQRGALLVSTTLATHEKVAGLLAGLRKQSIDPNAKPYESADQSEGSQMMGGGGFGGGGGMGGGGGAFSTPVTKATQLLGSD